MEQPAQENPFASPRTTSANLRRTKIAPSAPIDSYQYTPLPRWVLALTVLLGLQLVPAGMNAIGTVLQMFATSSGAPTAQLAAFNQMLDVSAHSVFLIALPIFYQ